MKDIYKKTSKIQVIGTLDVDENDNKFIRVDKGNDTPIKIIDFNSLIKELLGKQIKIETEEEIDG